MRDSIYKALRWALIPSLLVYIASLRLSSMAGIKGQLVLRDLAQTCGTPAGVGLISNIGYLLWLAASAVALFTAYSGQPGVRGKQRELLACGGWFSLILCIDDMFLLHDRYIGQTFLYAAYMVFAALIVTRYRRQLTDRGGELFFLAVALLGASIGIDQFQHNLPFKYENVQLVEEGAKFLGIATWVLYWWEASALTLKNDQSRISS